VELFPQLEQHPGQVELVSPAEKGLAVESVEEAATISSGIYDQMRLHFAPNEGDSQNPLSRKSSCGAVGPNCVIMADGRVLPLWFGDGAPQLRISLETLPGGFLFVPPGSDGELSVELAPVCCAVAPSAGSVQALPVLTGSAKLEQRVIAQKSTEPEP
jgi:hypothetical protein